MTGVAPFVINPMMVTHGDRTATGVLLKGVDPGLMPTVLDLPKHVVEGSLDGLRREGAKPPERAIDSTRRDYESPHTSLSSPDRPGASDGDRSDGGTDSLLAMIQREVDEEMRLMDAGARPPPREPADAGEPRAAVTPAPAPPQGKAADLTPTGG